MTVGVSCDALLRGSENRRAAPAPSARDGRSASGQGRRSSRGHCPSGDLPFAPAFICDAPAGGRVRHANDSGAAVASGCEHDDGVHARAQSRATGSTESAGSARGRRGGDAPCSGGCCRVGATQTCISERLAPQSSSNLFLPNDFPLIEATHSSRYTATVAEISVYRVLPTTC